MGLSGLSRSTDMISHSWDDVAWALSQSEWVTDVFLDTLDPPWALSLTWLMATLYHQPNSSYSISSVLYTIVTFYFNRVHSQFQL